MTRREQQAKQEILKILLEEGYKTYSSLFDMFDLNLTKDPNVVGYMEPSKARIVINENLSIDQVSFVVRHEILHEYLDHQLRMQQHMGKDEYDKRSGPIHQLINIAADYEISNRGYTDKDKITARNLRLGDKTVQGLVTELDHPDWTKLTVEEMFDRLKQEYDKNKEEMEQQLQQQSESGLDIGSGAGSAQQQMEDIEREAQEQAEMAEEAGDKNQQIQNQKISQAAGKAADEAEEQENQKTKDGKIFDSEEQKKKEEELAKRIENIKKAFKQASQNKSVEQDDYEASEKAEIAKAAKDAEKYNRSPLQKFKLSLNQFIRDEIATGRGDTWTRFNKKYSNTGLIKPGSSRLRQNKVPVINVYFDRSGSWDDTKTADGEKAMSFLNEYVRKGQIKINLYYFSNNVHGDRKSAEEEGGTEGQPILDHIKATNPDNVIIMTDSDIHDCRSDVVVPGAVYFLFKGGESQNLMDHLHGRRLTKKFDI